MGYKLAMRILAKIYVVIFVVAVLLAIAAPGRQFFGYNFSTDQSGDDKSKAFVLEEVHPYFPAASSLRIISEDEAEVLDAAGCLLGRLIHTQPQAKYIIGYGSCLPLIMVMNANGRIAGLILQAHQETPDFIAKLEAQDFFSSWNNLTASEAAILDVDAVSRATLTSQAVIDSVQLRLTQHVAVVPGQNRIEYSEAGYALAGWLFLLLSLLACCNLAGLAKYRVWLLLAAVVVPGFMLGRFISLELIKVWFVNGIPFQTQLFKAVVVIAAVAMALFADRAWYCSWYCPYGAAQELMGKVCRHKVDGGKKFAAAAKYLRPALLTIIIFVTLIGYKLNLNLFEPFSAFLLSSAARPVLVLAVFFLVLSLFIRKPWCNYFCPTGIIFEMLRFPRIFIKKIETKQEAGKMRFAEVANLLLIMVIMIQALSSARMVQSVPEQKSVKNDAVKSNNLVLQNIHQRKSVRSFSSEEVSEEQLTEIVKAGMAAPTARNRQPWQFVLLRDKAVMEALAEQLPYAKMLASASAAVVVCGDLEIARAGNSEKMWMLDCSAATQNILLAIESMGLGGVWTACYPYEDRMQAVSTALALPEHILPLCLIPVGYPAGNDKPKDKWKPERLHWDRWQIKKD